MSKTIPMTSIDKMLEEYNILRAKDKTIKTRMDELSKAIKQYATDNISKDSKGNHLTDIDGFTYGTQAKKTVKLNQEKAKAFFMEKNLLETVADVVTVVNEDKVSKLVESGTITAEDIEGIVDIRTTYSLVVKEREREEEMVEVQVASSTKPRTSRLKRQVVRRR